MRFRQLKRRRRKFLFELGAFANQPSDRQSRARFGDLLILFRDFRIDPVHFRLTPIDLELCSNDGLIPGKTGVALLDQILAFLLRLSHLLPRAREEISEHQTRGDNRACDRALRTKEREKRRGRGGEGPEADLSLCGQLRHPERDGVGCGERLLAEGCYFARRVDERPADVAADVA